MTTVYTKYNKSKNYENNTLFVIWGLLYHLSMVVNLFKFFLTKCYILVEMTIINLRTQSIVVNTVVKIRIYTTDNDF